MGHRLFGVGPGEPIKSMACSRRTRAFISQNFAGQSFGTGAINVNNVGEPANELTGSTTFGDGYAPSGTIHFNRYSPSGSAVDTETATGHSHGSYRTATADTRPATEKATGTDRWDASYAGDSNNIGPSGVESGIRSSRGIRPMVRENCL